MKVKECCAQCLFERQRNISEDPAFLGEIREIIDNRGCEDSAPYLVYLFEGVYRKYYGDRKPYASIKRKYNELVLSREDAIRRKIEASGEPLLTAFCYARAGNYIDFGAMNTVDEQVFLELLDQAVPGERDRQTMDAFLRQCKTAGKFLLLADNCGEIVLDKLLLEQIHRHFPELHLTVMVRGGEVLNDATEEDAVQSGIGRIARIVPNGTRIAGTVYEMLTEEAREAFDSADVILAKGQGNYETLNGQGRHIFYAFLCKCDLFTSRFQVPRLTGMFVEENAP